MKNEKNVYDNIRRLGDATLLVLLRLLDSYQDEELQTLGNMMKLLGRDSTSKLMEYFKGETVTFPSPKIVDDKLNELLCYIYYKIEGMTWEETLSKVYGDNVEPHKRKHLRNSLRDISIRIKKYNIDLEGDDVDSSSIVQR